MAIVKAWKAELALHIGRAWSGLPDWALGMARKVVWAETMYRFVSSAKKPDPDAQGLV